MKGEALCGRRGLVGDVRVVTRKGEVFQARLRQRAGQVWLCRLPHYSEQFPGIVPYALFPRLRQGRHMGIPPRRSRHRPPASDGQKASAFLRLPDCPNRVRLSPVVGPSCLGTHPVPIEAVADGRFNPPANAAAHSRPWPVGEDKWSFARGAKNPLVRRQRGFPSRE